jgi:hypothetical protein
VSVTVDCRFPFTTVGVDQLAVMPAGSGAILKIAPETLEARETPPTGLAVTITAPVPIDAMLSEAGERLTESAGAAVTLRLSVDEAVRPSPDAVIVSVEALSAAVEEGLSVNVEVTEPFAEGV